MGRGGQIHDSLIEIPRPWLKNYKLEAKGRKTKNTSGLMFEK